MKGGSKLGETTHNLTAFPNLGRSPKLRPDMAPKPKVMVHGQSGSERSRALSTSPLRVPLLHSGESLEETPARGSSAFVGGAAAADEHSVYVRLPHWTLYKCVQPQTTCTPLSLSRARAPTHALSCQTQSLLRIVSHAAHCALFYAHSPAPSHSRWMVAGSAHWD